MSGTSIKKRKSFIPQLAAFLCIAAAAGTAAFFSYRMLKKYREAAPSLNALQKSWQEYDYPAVYAISRRILDSKPLSNTALTYHGYACFYLAVSQLDNSASQNYLDEAISSLRTAYYTAQKNLVPQIEYMLGKSYFYKNTITSYYYADLAAKYLDAAAAHGYKAKDIPEYLGLSYAALGMTTESISAFTEALLVRESDTLLLSIAEQYYKAGQASAAKQYLYRIKNGSRDDSLLLKSMNLLGMIYIEDGNYADARKEFESILQKKQNSADAYYGLGIIYEKQGNLAKARSEWRKALKIQVNHAGALAKIADYK